MEIKTNPLIEIWNEYDEKWNKDKEAHKDDYSYRSQYDPLYFEYGSYTENHTANINISDMETFLVQQVGRFCERYASDIMIDHDTLMRVINNPNGYDDPYYMYLGLRESGVDGISFVTSNMDNYQPSYMTHYYRKLYSIRVRKHREEGRLFASSVFVELRDFTGEIYRLTAKIKETGFTSNDLYPETPESKRTDIMYNICQMGLLHRKFTDLQTQTADLLKKLDQPIESDMLLRTLTPSGQSFLYDILTRLAEEYPTPDKNQQKPKW